MVSAIANPALLHLTVERARCLLSHALRTLDESPAVHDHDVEDAGADISRAAELLDTLADRLAWHAAHV